MRKVYLVRHASPDFKDDIKLCIGHTDIDIGKKGIEEAERLKIYFRDKNIEKIFTSPLSRCLNTARIISDCKLPIVIDDRLKEIYMGEWEGLPLRDIVKNLGDEPKSGEKRVDALKRINTALNELIHNTSGDIVVVSHAGISCCFIAQCIGQDIKTSRGIKVGYGSYTTFEYDGVFNCLEIGILPI